MPFDLPLPDALHCQGWRIKILDREMREEPHATVCFRTWKWRFGLRSRRYLDRHPDPSDIPASVQQCLMEQLQRLTEEWNSQYPRNPV